MKIYPIPNLYHPFIGCLLLFVNPLPAQVGPDRVSITGEVLTPLDLTEKTLTEMGKIEFKTKDRDGQEHVFQGVPLHALLDSAGVGLGSRLRGEHLAKYVLIRAADGYEVIFSLPEIDPEFTGQTVLLAYRMDGLPLPKGEGPFRMVAPLDKRQARWVREVREIKILFSKD